MSPRGLLWLLQFPSQEEGQHGWWFIKEGTQKLPTQSLLSRVGRAVTRLHFTAGLAGKWGLQLGSPVSR